MITGSRLDGPAETGRMNRSRMRRCWWRWKWKLTRRTPRQNADRLRCLYRPKGAEEKQGPLVIPRRRRRKRPQAGSGPNRMLDQTVLKGCRRRPPKCLRPERFSSKALSQALRHSAPREGLTVRPDGRFPLGAILRTSRLEEMQATADEIIAVVRQSDKQRYELSTHQGQQMLRATQGHSFAVDRNLVQFLGRSRDQDASVPIFGHPPNLCAGENVPSTIVCLRLRIPSTSARLMHVSACQSTHLPSWLVNELCFTTS